MARPRTPTHLKLVKSTTRKSRANAAEPAPLTGAPPMPIDLAPAAVEAWPVFAKILHDMGVLTVADGPALRGMCEAAADKQAARLSLARDVVVQEVLEFTGEPGDVTLAAGGELTYQTHGKGGWMIRARPEVAMIADADRRLLAYFAQFGLTPAARSKVQLNPGSAKDEAEALFG